MKRIIGILGMSFCMALGHAQNLETREAHDAFEEFRNSVYKDFSDFRKQCLADFVDFVRNSWKEFGESKPIPLPKEDPKPPVVMPEEDRKKPVNNNPVVIEDVVKPAPILPQPRPIEPIEEVPVAEERYVDFDFFGTAAKVRFDNTKRFRLHGIDENSVADALNNIKAEDYDNMMIDCLKLREELQLSDWAYLQMLKTISEQIAGKDSNEGALLLAYMYMMSGYKMRLASDGSKLYMLYASQHQIYEKASYEINNEIYYGVEELPSKLYICEASFPKEKSLSLLISSPHLFAHKESTPRELVSKRYDDLKVAISVNENLLDFYDCYPASMLGNDFMTRWAMYANTPFEEKVQETLYASLRPHIKDVPQKEAANRLLNFVQTGFQYEYDDKVWGHDRTFFPEETLHYPYADCEDRSILFTRLVRDLLGLKCVLVYYPGHLASAVCFTENVTGDYVMLDGSKYVVCDPTYIGAPVGATMPDMSNAEAKVILLE